jgi:hypothetical protein
MGFRFSLLLLAACSAPLFTRRVQRCHFESFSKKPNFISNELPVKGGDK